MVNDFNSKVTPDTKDEWLTPRYITDALGEFDLDVCEPFLPDGKDEPRCLG